MKNSFKFPQLAVDDLLFEYIDDPEADIFLRQDLKKHWNVVDWDFAKEEIIGQIRDIFPAGNVSIAWCGWSAQAKKIFSEVSIVFSTEKIEWYLLSNDENITVSSDDIPIKKIPLDSWAPENFILTINVERYCPQIFYSFNVSCNTIFVSPFTDQYCSARMRELGHDSMITWLKNLNEDIENNRIVIFVALRHGNFPSIEHIANELRQVPGVKVYAIYLEPDVPVDVYDNVYICNYSLALLSELLALLPPIVVYLQAHASWAYLSQLINAINPQLKVVQEVYDWMGAFISDEKLFAQEGVFSSQQISLMQKSEDYICNHLHGYIYKDNGAWMQQRVKESRTPAVKIFPCPSLSYLHKPHSPQNSFPIKLVYAGQVSHRQQPKKIFGDMYYMPLVKDLTCQGFHLTIYNALSHGKKYPPELYKEYLDEEKASPLFEFKKGIPMPGIIEALNGKYHYGLLAYYFEDDLGVGSDHLKGTMASKLFTYLAAGLPVIVSEQFEYMAKIVLDDGIGVVVSRNDLRDLTSVVEQIDYAEMLGNINYAQKKYSMSSQISGLQKLLMI
jgi:glycosyltransferase involved in cell wall biosynthesis